VDGIAQGVPTRYPIEADSRVRVNDTQCLGGTSIQNYYFLHGTGKLHCTILYGFVRPPPNYADTNLAGECKTPVWPAHEPPPSREAVENTIRAMIESVTIPGFHSLAPLLTYALEKCIETKGGGVLCHPAIARLLYPLITPSVCFACVNSGAMVTIFKSLLEKVKPDVEIEGLVEKHCPWVSQFLANTNNEFIPDYAKPAFKHLLTLAEWSVDKSSPCFTIGAQGKQSKYLYALETSEIAEEKELAGKINDARSFESRSSRESIEEDMRQGGAFHPSLQQRRKGVFEYGGATFNASQFGYHSCEKSAPTSKAHTPGYLTLFCPHGFCYGIQFFRSGESPVHVFDMIFSRIPVEHKPKVIM
jgi:hypothetical protein